MKDVKDFLRGNKDVAALLVLQPNDTLTSLIFKEDLFNFKEADKVFVALTTETIALKLAEGSIGKRVFKYGNDHYLLSFGTRYLPTTLKEKVLEEKWVEFAYRDDKLCLIA